jgi:cytochrome o ubiquinol oxidase subunit 2
MQSLRDTMSVNKVRQFCISLFVGLTTFLLTGCKLEVLNPKGMIAKGEARLLIESTLLMLIIVVPVLLLIIIIAWRYRESNKKAEYKPNWGHSNLLEAICWAIPCIIIAILAAMTWVSTHKLDPYRPIKIAGRKPIVIQAVALDWKWLFIFPEQHIATVNYFEIPVHTPVRFEITADAPMNSLEIPRLAGQIYAMGAMRTILHMTADQPGVYRGLSTNYSGDGFAGMHFSIRAGSTAEFNRWVQHVQQTSPHWSYDVYRRLARPSKRNKPEFFSGVPSDFFMKTVIGQFLSPSMAASTGTK